MSKTKTAKKKIPANVQYDAQGFPHNGDCRLTLCCYAAATCDETGVTYCKGCYKDVDPAYGDVIAISPKQKMQHPVKVSLVKRKSNKQYSIESIIAPNTKGGIIPKSVATPEFIDAVRATQCAFNKPLDKARKAKDGGIKYRKVFADYEKLSASIAKWDVANVCKYCKRDYTYPLIIGDNMHSCGRRACVRSAMSEFC